MVRRPGRPTIDRLRSRPVRAELARPPAHRPPRRGAPRTKACSIQPAPPKRRIFERLAAVTGTEHVFAARSGRIVGFAGGTLAALALAAAAALAAAPVTGAEYTGALAGPLPKITISFRVSASGREVENLRIGRLPIYCGGSGPPGTP